jgi:hypothetical protein
VLLCTICAHHPAPDWRRRLKTRAPYLLVRARSITKSPNSGGAPCAANRKRSTLAPVASALWLPPGTRSPSATAVSARPSRGNLQKGRGCRRGEANAESPRRGPEPERVHVETFPDGSGPLHYFPCDASRYVGTSFTLNVRRLDNWPPSFNLSLLESAQSLRRLLITFGNLQTQVGIPCAYCRVGQRIEHGSTKLCGDIPRSAFRREQGNPHRSKEVRDTSFLGRWNFRC